MVSYCITAIPFKAKERLMYTVLPEIAVAVYSVLLSSDGVD